MDQFARLLPQAFERSSGHRARRSTFFARRAFRVYDEHDEAERVYGHRRRQLHVKDGGRRSGRRSRGDLQTQRTTAEELVRSSIDADDQQKYDDGANGAFAAADANERRRSQLRRPDGGGRVVSAISERCRQRATRRFDVCRRSRFNRAQQRWRRARRVDVHPTLDGAAALRFNRRCVVVIVVVASNSKRVLSRAHRRAQRDRSRSGVVPANCRRATVDQGAAQVIAVAKIEKHQPN